MVYNRDSVWYHLYAAYFLRFVDASPLYPLSMDEIQRMDVDDIFRRSTDGVNCPLARCWSPETFINMCIEAGFSRAEFLGGYPNSLEPGLAKNYIEKALQDERLEEEHKLFLRTVGYDKNGYPIGNDGKSCCIGGVYRLWK